MQFPIIIGLRRSRSIDCALAGLTGVSLLVLASVPWLPEISLALAGALLLLALQTARRLAPTISTLRIDADGKFSGRAPGQDAFVPLKLLPGSTAHQWLTVLRLTGASREYRLLIAADSVVPEEFRRLRVFLRWRAEVSDGAGDS